MRASGAGGRGPRALLGALLVAGAFVGSACGGPALGCEDVDEVVQLQTRASELVPAAGHEVDEVAQLQTRGSELVPAAGHEVDEMAQLQTRGSELAMAAARDQRASFAEDSKPAPRQGKGLNKEQVMIKLRAKGFFLGASRDFWIILSMCLGAVLVALIAVLCVSNSIKTQMRELEGSLSSRGFSEGLDWSIPKPVFKLSHLQSGVLRGEENPVFAKTADISLRGALMCIACTAPYYLPCLTWMIEQGWSMQYVVVIITFTLYKDLGTTIQLAWLNFVGTIVPIVNTLTLYSIFPNGTSVDGMYSTTWFIGAFDLVVFCGLTLAFEVPLGIKMFALSWQAYFSMCFLNPSDDTMFSIGFNKILLEGAAMGPLAGTLIGVTLSIIIMLSSPLGPCVSNLGASLEIAMELAWQEGELWKDLVTDFTGKKEDSHIVQFAGEITQLKIKLGQLYGCLSTTWWESLGGVGHGGRVERNLKALADTLADMKDLGSLRTLDLTPGPDHARLMELLGPKMKDLANAAAHLLYRAARVGAEGGLADEGGQHRAALEQGLGVVSERQRELAATLASAREQVCGPAFSDGSLSENCMVLALSTFCLHTTKYAEYLLAGGGSVSAEHASRHPSPLGALWAGLKESCRPAPLDATARNCLAFFGCFVLGYTGLHGAGPRSGTYAVTPLDSTIAGTTAFLMSAEGKGGSALWKNIGRFLGTGGGTLLGSLVFLVSTDCSWHGEAVGLVAMLSLMFLSFNLYFMSAQYGYVGLLLAAYGGKQFATVCNSTDQTEATVLQQIVDQFAAIIAVTLTEVIIPNEKASEIAVQSYTDAYKSFLDAFRAYLGIGLQSDRSPTGGALPQTKTESFRKLVEVQEKGLEAALEPRMLRTPWRAEFWDKALLPTMKMSAEIMALTSLDTAQNACPFRQAVAASDTMTKKGDDLARRAEESFSLVASVLMHDDTKPIGFPDNEYATLLKSKRTMSDWADSMKAVILEAAARAKSAQGQSAVEVATEDIYCKASMSLLMLSNIARNFADLEDAILQLPEMSARSGAGPKLSTHS